MKHHLLLMIAIIGFVQISKAEEPAISMTTANTVGQNIGFSLAAQSNSTTIQVDFGDGTLVNFIIGKSDTQFNSQIISTQTIKIYGSGITSLRCNSNQLTALDIKNCITLTYINCNNNLLSSLDISKCTALQYLYCNNNQYTVLDFTNCAALTTLDCSNNTQLSTLNITNCSALNYLDCFDNNQY